MKHLLATLLLTIVATALSACNTVKGVGQDVSAGGRDLTKAANTVEHKIQNYSPVITLPKATSGN